MGGFTKVSIAPEGQGQINVLFNPTNYSIDKANTIAEIAIPGLGAPILQYVHGNTRTLSMELFCDTYEERTNVTAVTNKIYKLLEIIPSTHVAPICNISWGSLRFRGVLDHCSGKFTMFLSDGTPVRATLTVVFKEYIDVADLVRITPTESADHRKAREVRAGDRLSSIAAEEYGDPKKWRPIADANGLDDPRQLKPGQVLVIPALT
jgi:hypothetical protein